MLLDAIMMLAWLDEDDDDSDDGSDDTDDCRSRNKLFILLFDLNSVMRLSNAFGHFRIYSQM